MLQIYYGDVSGLSPSAEGLPLSAYRLEKLHSLKPPLARRQGIGAELLLIHALRAHFGEVSLPLVIEAEQGGKPVLRELDLFFSLSHSGTLAACALSDGPVGLDIQKRSAFRPGVLERFFTPDERQYVLDASDRDEAYTEIWTRKESWLKAMGIGISFSLSAFSGLQPPEPAKIWQKTLGTYSFALCTLGTEPVPNLLERVKLF